MQVTLNTDDFPKARALLKEAQKRGENTKPLMAEIANHLYTVVEESFEYEKTPDGLSWDPIQYRKNDKHPEKILFDSGDMQDSLNFASSNDEAIVGLNATHNGYPFPFVHQFGSLDGKTPARAFMPIHKDSTLYDSVEEEIVDIIVEYFKIE